ncbi:MAG: hypothetical protein VW446_12730, partial [Alphaproteobacteria bacterium]
MIGARHIITGILALATALPVIAGIIGVMAPAIGLFPPLGFVTPSLDPAREFLATPGLGRAGMTSLITGLGATCLALLFSFALVVTYADARQ